MRQASCRSSLSVFLFGGAVCAVSACGGGAFTAAPADGGQAGDAVPSIAAPDAGGVSLGFTPSNVDLGGMDLSHVGAWVVDQPDCTIDSETNLTACGDPNSLAFKIATLPDASHVGVYVARSIRIEATAKLAVTGGLPIVLIALDKIEILGGLFANAQQEMARGGGSTQMTGHSKGGGAGGGLAGTTTAAPGGGSYCGVGGTGAAESGVAAGIGGVAFGTAEIVPLVGGASGGAGETIAGAGGGAIELVAANSIVVTSGAFIDVGGGGGGFGGTNGQEASGGGSGGAILIESARVTIAGTLASNGGGAGAGGGGGIPSGADATPDDKPALGGNAISGNSAGGNGSAAAGIHGTSGAVTAGYSAGAGGGGAGRIRINTKSGAATITGLLSPALSTPCATQGTVTP